MPNNTITAIGIIAEYNPFHNGHLHQIELAKREFPGCPVICVMSGNFVQRGEPAIWNKFVRARAALICGADMIIELPLPFATSSAEYFSYYAVQLLDSLGFVAHLCFGSETGDIETLETAAKMLLSESTEFKTHLKKRLAEGHSYPLARHMTLAHLAPEVSDAIKTPNNILGIEYIKALSRLDSKIKPFVIKREGESYHSEDYTKKLSSATAIRTALRAGHKELAGIPEALVPLYKEHIELGSFHDFDNLSTILQYIVKTRAPEELAGIMDIDEGLHNGIIDACGSEKYISGILSRLKSKRYAYTRLSRALLHIVLDITKDDFQEFCVSAPHYVRVLGFRKKWECLFSHIEAEAAIPIVTNLKNHRDVLPKLSRKLLEKEILSTDIYNLSGTDSYSKNAEFSESIIVV